MKYKQARNIVYDSLIHDRYHQERGDNYNFKSEWTTPKNVKPSNGLWKHSYKYWHQSNKDLNMHDAAWYKCDMDRYESENNPRFKRTHADALYEYDNPFMRKLDKYNQGGYEVTSKGYQKSPGHLTASIQRKRRTVW